MATWKWQNMIAGFYKDFHPLIEKSEDISRQEVSQARLIGQDPAKTYQFTPVLAAGPMLQRGETDSEDKPDFAPLPKGTTIDTVTLEQALTAFQLPPISRPNRRQPGY